MICTGAVGSTRARAVVVLVLAAALTCCGRTDPQPDGPTATVGTAPTTTNPYAVPNVIDAAYVNRVLVGLDQAVGDVVRLVASTRAFTPEAVERLRALYVGEFLTIMAHVLQEDLVNGMPGYKPVPGNKRSTVTNLITAGSSCIFAEVARDFSEVGFTHDPRLDTQWVGLVPLDPAKDVNGYNGTSWVYIYDGFPEDHSQPEDPCVRTQGS